MLRQIRLALLFLALAAYASAWTFPDGLIMMPRQLSPRLVTDTGSTAVSPADQAGNTSPSTTTGAGTGPTTSPTTSIGGSTTTTTKPTTSETPTPSSTPPSQTPPTTTTTTQPPTTSDTSTPTTTSQQNSTPSTVTTDVTSMSTITGSSSQATDPTSSQTSAAPTTEAAATTTARSNTAVHETLTTIIITSNGHAVTSVAKATVTGSDPASTSEPGLAQGYGGGNSTLSDVGKKVIAGIVGGVGGALLIAGIAFVVYRVWFRKNHQGVPQEDDYFAGSSDSVAAQKKTGGWGPTSLTSKFSEPLDRYKSPTSPASLSSGYKSPNNLNAASNF